MLFSWSIPMNTATPTTGEQKNQLFSVPQNSGLLLLRGFAARRLKPYQKWSGFQQVAVIASKEWLKNVAIGASAANAPGVCQSLFSTIAAAERYY